MDKYDSLILEIIQTHKERSEDKKRIGLLNLERSFLKIIESDEELKVGHGRVGERITRLYINGLIENKNGYGLTRKGRSQLELKSKTL